MMSEHAPILELNGVSKSFIRGENEVRALSDVTLGVDRGDFVVLLGPSGSGKTTLLNIVGAIEPASSGKVRLDDTDIGALHGRDLDMYRRTKVGFVFQFFNLVPTLTAEENVEVIAELTGGDARRRSAAALRDVGLADAGDRFPGQLSGGEQQRVAIARALVKCPPVLLADEPTGSLDLDTGRQILGLLRDAADQGACVLVVTHNSAIAGMADRVVHLSDGRIAGDEEVADPVDASEIEW
jgi:putative ABC transport system ATP-binding protein